nr:MAG TPA: hypothetical protein [Caudoviricetes sp.]
MTDEVVKFLDKYGDKIPASYEVLKEQSKWHDVMVYWIIISTIILVIGLIFVTIASFGTDSFDLDNWNKVMYDGKYYEKHKPNRVLVYINITLPFVILFNTVFSVWLSWQLAPDYNLINNLINR